MIIGVPIFQHFRVYHLLSCLLSLMGSILKERFCSMRSKFFPIRIYPILKGNGSKKEVTNGVCFR